MEIAVTGASGHIGSNLCRRLTAAGHRVRAQYQTNRVPLAGLPVELFSGDVRDSTFVRDFIEGAEVVFHLAARISISGDRSGDVWATNVEGTRQVSEACRVVGVKRLIHFSSIHAFEQKPRDEPLDEARDPVGPSAFAYDWSKAAGEEVVRGAVARGLDAVILNPTAVIGPEDPRPSRMGRVLVAMVRGRMPVLVDGGFDWVDVRDVVEAAVSAMERGRAGTRYLLSGTWASLERIAGLVDSSRGLRRRRWILPVGVARSFVTVVGVAARLAGAPPVFTRESLAIVEEGNRRVQHDLAARDLGFRPRPLDQTIEDSLRYFDSFFQ